MPIEFLPARKEGIAQGFLKGTQNTVLPGRKACFLIAPNDIPLTGRSGASTAPLSTRSHEDRDDSGPTRREFLQAGFGATLALMPRERSDKMTTQPRRPRLAVILTQYGAT